MLIPCIISKIQLDIGQNSEYPTPSGTYPSELYKDVW